MKTFGKTSRGRSQGVPKVLRAPLYGAHCAVIFAIAQLSYFIDCLSHTEGWHDLLLNVKINFLPDTQFEVDHSCFIL